MGSEFRELILGAEYMDLLGEPGAAPAPEIDLDSQGEAMADNLAEQAGIYSAYIEASERQKMALVNGNLAENQAINLESEGFLSALANLETERLGIAERVLSAYPELAPSAAQLKCEALSPLLGASAAERLEANRASLRKAVADLRRVLNINAALVENGSRIIHTTIGIITSVVGRGKNEKLSTYTKKGAVNLGKVQIRNLINRSV